MTLEEVQKDVESQAQQVQVVSNEVERLKQQLASEKKNASDTSMELQALKLELEKNKNEAEHLKMLERNSEERRYARSKTRLELEDAKNTIAELKEELTYKSSVNRSLGLQLEKTIESNSELLLEIKDLDDLLQRKDKELEELKAKLRSRESFQERDDEKSSWIVKLEESGRERNQLETDLSMLDKTRGNQLSDNSIHDLMADNEMLRQQLEKAETEFANTSKENMNLLSQLMVLRHQTDEKSTLVQQLEQRLEMVQEQSSIQVEALEEKARDLQDTADDLREELHRSEELSQSQLDSNKVFMEDLISTVEGLRARNEQLENMLKSSEEINSGLIEELEARKQELLEHEKEQSLLASQRGQLKTLREKIATLTENYEIAREREEELELAIKVLKGEHSKTLAHLDAQLRHLEGKLHDADAECMALKAEVQMAASPAAETNEQINSLRIAKEIAEANASSLNAAFKELQKHYDLLLLDKEKVVASLSSLQVAHDKLQEHLKDIEQRGSEAIHQLQERDINIIELSEALNSAESQLRRACEQTSESEAVTLALQEELQHTKEEIRLQIARIEDLELKLFHMREDLDESSRSVSASEERVQNLQVRNSDLSDMLRSAVSYKEDVVSRLETALAKEMELETKLQETQAALQKLRSEKVTCDQTIEELQEKICLLKDERTASGKGKEEDGDARELHKILRTQVEVLKNSMREMKLQKEKAESSLQKLQTNNTSLAQELRKWKEKVKAGNEELALWKEKVKMSQRPGTSLEEKTCQVLDSNNKGTKKSTDVDQKSEVLKLRKQAADLRRKLLEQEEEKEDMKKKLISIQKEVQRKSELVNLTEKRLKEREKEHRAGQRPPTRHSSSTSRRIGMVDSNMVHGGKTTADLVEKVKALEAELNIKTVELEATQFLLKKQERGADSNLHIESEEGVDTPADTDKPCPQPEQFPSQSPNGEQHQLLTDVTSLETLQDEVQRLQAENQRLKNLHLEHKEEETNSGNDSTFSNGSNQHPPERDTEEEKETHLREELCEMKDRYSQLSLQFAELQIEREELLVTIKSLSKDGCR